MLGSRLVLRVDVDHSLLEGAGQGALRAPYQEEGGRSGTDLEVWSHGLKSQELANISPKHDLPTFYSHFEGT